MAEYGKAIDDVAGLAADEDLSGKQYTAVYLSGANKVKFATSTNSSLTLGILQNKPTSGQAATVRDLGTTKWYAGAAVTAGAHLTVNGSGRAIVVTSGGMVLGQALDAAGADGELLTARVHAPVRWGQVP